MAKHRENLSQKERTSKSRQRLRMQEAFEQVQDWRNINLAEFNEFNQKLKGLGVELRSQGLVVILAGLYSKRSDSKIGDAIVQWLQKCPHSSLAKATSRNEGRRSVFDQLLEADQAGFRYLQEEALLFVEELKRFAQVIPGQIPTKDSTRHDKSSPSDSQENAS